MYASSLLINKLTIYVITIITMLNLALFLKTCFSHSSSGLLTASTGDSPQIIIAEINTIAEIPYILKGMYVIITIATKYIIHEDI